MTKGGLFQECKLGLIFKTQSILIHHNFFKKKILQLAQYTQVKQQHIKHSLLITILNKTGTEHQPRKAYR
jgi:hypothetical protein